MRTLISVPVAHEIVESVDPEFFKHELMRAGIFLEYQYELESYWYDIDAYLCRKNIQKVYPEGLAFSTAAKLSNSKASLMRHTWASAAMCDLVDRGATVVQTESSWLMRLARASYALRCDAPPDWIVQLRDTYIAKSINETLGEKQTGVLFLGGAHNVDKIIKSKYPSIHVDRFDEGYKRIENILFR